MANITIDVVGNSSGGSQQPPQTQQGGFNQPGSSISPGVSEADQQRLVNDIRREMQQRGVVFVPGSNNVNQIISQYTQQVQKQGEEQIHSKYISQREDLADWRRREQSAINEKYRKLREPYDPDDPYAQSALNRLDRQEESEIKALNRQWKEELAGVDKREQEEKDEYNENVVARMQEIIEILKDESSSDNPNSYIGNLRKEQRELIAQREGATTREEAMDISRRLNNVNERLREATTGDPANKKFFRDPALQTSQGFADLFRSLEGGSIGGTINSLGTIGVGLSGASLGTAMKALGWIGLIATIGQGAWNMFSGAGERLEGAADIASWRATSGGKVGREASEDVLGMLGGNILINGTTYTDLGLKRDDFEREASRRIRQRGISENWYREVMEQIALERTFGLESGSIGAAGRFDRYGINATEGISGMMALLMSIPTSGVSRTDFTRVQEKYDIQQQIMQSYLGRTDRPDYNIANANLAAFSAVKGITQDARLGSDFAVFQNAIQNPMNDKFKALLYNTVSNIPGLEYTRGRPDLIERAIIDPDNEGKIIQAVVKNVKQIYGGTETTMGYYAFRNLFPNISPDRLDAYINAIANGDSDTAQILKKGIKAFPGIGGEQDMARISQQITESGVTMSKEYQSRLLSTTREIRNTLERVADNLTGNANNVMNSNNGAREAGL